MPITYFGPQHPKGFTLIEVLIAVSILTVGLLGLVSLQAIALRYNHQSLQLSTATQLANEMADRMRANPAGVKTNKYDTITAKPATDPGCNAAHPCNPMQLATHDAFEWYTEISQLLTAGNGSVNVSGTLFTINLAWQEVEKNGTVNTQNLSVTFKP